jgi:hypothetical protein
MRLLICLILIVNTALAKPTLKPKLEKEEVLNYMDSLGIEYPEIVWAQAVWETGHFRSKLYVYNNNLFGMRVARSRQHTAIGKRFGYARYLSWQESVLDYKYFQQLFIGKIKSEKDYFRYLDRHYSAGKRYSKSIKKIL